MPIHAKIEFKAFGRVFSDLADEKRAAPSNLDLCKRMNLEAFQSYKVALLEYEKCKREGKKVKIPAVLHFKILPFISDFRKVFEVSLMKKDVLSSVIYNGLPLSSSRASNARFAPVGKSDLVANPLETVGGLGSGNDAATSIVASGIYQPAICEDVLEVGNDAAFNTPNYDAAVTNDSMADSGKPRGYSLPPKPPGAGSAVQAQALLRD